VSRTGVIPPYRVEWRPDLVTNFWAHKNAASLEEARAIAADLRRQHPGQTRIIVQAVTEVVHNLYPNDGSET
jgi:hypothetical protein